MSKITCKRWPPGAPIISFDDNPEGFILLRAGWCDNTLLHFSVLATPNVSLALELYSDKAKRATLTQADTGTRFEMRLSQEYIFTRSHGVVEDAVSAEMNYLEDDGQWYPPGLSGLLAHRGIAVMNNIRWKESVWRIMKQRQAFHKLIGINPRGFYVTGSNELIQACAADAYMLENADPVVYGGEG